MARASTRTKLPIATWGRILGVNPLHLSQVFFGEQVHCDNAMPQYTWQEADRISREEIAIAILEAEDIIENWLGYRLLPSWEVDEWRPGIRPARPELVNVGMVDIRGYNQLVDARWGWFISGGIEAKTLIQAGRPIAYSDGDGDGYDETATVTAAVAAGTDPCEVEVYFPGKDGADIWQIRPASVSVAGLVATITFRRELAVDPDLNEAIVISAVDGSVDANFLTEVDVYRRYNDPSTQASLLWENTPNCGQCGGSGCAACDFTTQTACLNVRGDPRLGMVSYAPATWNAVTESFDADGASVFRTPDVVRLYYRAGYRDMRKDCPTVQMDDRLARMVAYLAAAMLDRPPCDCSSSTWGYWNEDLGSDLKFVAQTAKLNNPLGTRRGQVYVWDRLHDPGPAVAIGRGGMV